jgi:putative Mg2+ transporter-C (MgtC) family protein
MFLGIELYEYGLVAKFALALILGLVIGIERELQGKPAGMRTYAMITAAAAAFVLLGLESIQYVSDLYPNSAVTADPIRIVHAIIVGISFLGAGTILKDKNKDAIYYLTTSATVLAAASVGIAVAFSRYFLAVSITLIILAINWLLIYPERWIKKKSKKIDS